MPQFDFNILNTQNVNIFSFSISYLFYVKSIFFFFFYNFKYPYKLLMSVCLYVLKELSSIYNYISTFFSMLLPFLIKVRFFVSFFMLENNFYFFYK